MERPIFILGSHKSGTSLLRNLFDGVPELFVIPKEIHFFNYTGYGTNYALRYAPPRAVEFEDVLAGIEKAIIHSNTKPEDHRKHGDSYLAGCWNVGAAMDYLRDRGADAFQRRDMPAFFNRYVEALHVGLYGQPPTAQRFVEKSVESAEFGVLLKKMFPDAKFVHIVRNPYGTLTSLRKFKTVSRRYPYLGPLIESLRNSFYYLHRNPMLIDDYLCVRYEDLLTDTEANMRRIAAFVEIDYSDTLLKPMSMGQAWSGNSMSGKDFDGLSTYPISAWKKDIHPLEIMLVNLLFQHVLDNFGYDREPDREGVYRPAAGENVQTYIANRFTLQQYKTLHRTHPI